MKDKILERVRGREVYNSNEDKNNNWFATRNNASNKQFLKYFQSTEVKKTHQPIILYPENISFKAKGKIMTRSDNRKWENV